MSLSHNYLTLCCLLTITIIINGFPYNGKIVGGSESSIMEYPYIISLRYGNRHVCGGAILDSTTILTAAHCVKENISKYYTIAAGTDFSNKGGSIVPVKSIIIHSNYSSTTFDNDIAILKIHPLSTTISIQPIQLPRQNEIVGVNTISIVAGWGFTEEDGQTISSRIRYISIPIIENSKCKQLYVNKGQVTRRQICAGMTKGGKDACQGDSGGPMAANGKIIGIVSWGYGCARPGYPGVYTRVSKYRSWIDSKK